MARTAESSQDMTDTYIVGLLRACTKQQNIYGGLRLHADILKQGFHEKSDDVANKLVVMYVKCGALAKADCLLDELSLSDVFSWNTLILGYVQLQHAEEDAFRCFEQMQHAGLSPNGISLALLIKACTNIRAAGKGIEIHKEIAKLGLLGEDIVLGSALVDMYVKCRALAKAQQVLEELPRRNIVSWSALIAGYAQLGQSQNALNCFEWMQGEGLVADVVTYSCLLKVCGSARDVERGCRIHDEIVRQDLLSKNILLGTALVDMYAKCNEFSRAQQVLEELPDRDVICWSALIAGYAQQGKGQDALECYEKMKGDGLLPDIVTFTCILNACGSIGAAGKGEEIHDEILRKGLLGKDMALGNALVDMYGKCGALKKAQKVLEELPARDVVSWSALISGYAQHGQGEDALHCFNRMESEGLSPDALTFVYLLQVCGSLGAVEKGEQIHGELTRHALLEVNVVLANALVNMYVKCGALMKAKCVLKDLPSQDVVSWSTVMAGYVQQGQGEEALECFDMMQCQGLNPDEVTYACILKACGSVGALGKGEQIHEEIAGQGLLTRHPVLGNALVDMYAKCGELVKAHQVFNGLPFQNVISWNALLTGYAHLGEYSHVRHCFEQIEHKGLNLDAATFLCALHLFSHSGLVSGGETCFGYMTMEHGIRPELEHYSCMVDVFGRAGSFDKAVVLIQRMPMPSSDYPAVWSSLLGACRTWEDVNIGRWAFEHAIELDKSATSAYISMANMYVSAGMPDDAEIIEALRVKNKAW